MNSNARKVCKKCLKNKLFSLFYKHPSCKDGHFGKCKKCKDEDDAIRIANYDPVKTEKRKQQKRDSENRILQERYSEALTTLLEIEEYV